MIEQLANYLFDGELLHVDIDHGAFVEQASAGFGYAGARDFQLNRSRCLRNDFAHGREIAGSGVLKTQVDQLEAREPVDDGVERAVEKDSAMIDDDHPVTQLLDILHIMTGQHRDNSVLGVVETEKLANAFLANDIEPDCGFIQEKDARLVEKS